MHIQKEMASSQEGCVGFLGGEFLFLGIDVRTAQMDVSTGIEHGHVLGFHAQGNIQKNPTKLIKHFQLTHNKNIKNRVIFFIVCVVCVLRPVLHLLS